MCGPRALIQLRNGVEAFGAHALARDARGRLRLQKRIIPNSGGMRMNPKPCGREAGR